MRYSFYDQLAKIRKNPYHILPEDINQPIIEWLNKIGCSPGAAAVMEAQKNVGYQKIELIHEKAPNAKIIIQVDSGMVGERKEWEKKNIGPWEMIITKTVKNPNLDKKKPPKKRN